MSLTIGIPREIYPGEKRVAAVPDVVEKWRKLGFSVAVESGAGALANFADDTYIAAGASSLTTSRRSSRRPMSSSRFARPRQQKWPRCVPAPQSSASFGRRKTQS